MQSKARLVLLVLLGVGLAICGHLALKGLDYLAYPNHNVTANNTWVPGWYALSRPLVATLVQLGPAFLVGWGASRSGFILGALVGLLSSVAVAALFLVAWQNVSLSPLEWSLYFNLFVWALPSAVSSSVAGAAGQFARTGRPLTIHSSGRRSGAA